jgi:hypothetical protein
MMETSAGEFESRPCQLCGAGRFVARLDLGRQPISNRFLASADAPEALFPLALIECGTCGLVQLEEPAPAMELISPYPWVTYNEPERHLDELAGIIRNLPGVTPDSKVWGLSFKDDTLLRRLERLGLSGTYRVAPGRDLDVHKEGAGIETLQDRLSASKTENLAGRIGRPQVIIARHFLEHSHSLETVLGALTSVLAPDGYLVIEVPDCGGAFSIGDCTTIWEEHTLFLSDGTLRAIFDKARFRCVMTRNFPCHPEPILVGIAQKAAPREAIKPARSAFSSFATSLPARRKRVVERIEADGPAVVLGAGHLACAFVNFLDLGSRVKFVVDDNPNKQGLFMPGSRLPIRPSDALLSEHIGLCLLSVNPEVEAKVMDKNRAFVERGGRFASIFAASERSLF